MQRPGQFRPVSLAPALHLGEPGDDLGAALPGVSGDSLALRLQPETAGTLPCKCRMKNPQMCRMKVPHFRELGSAGIRHGRLRFLAADRVVLAAAAG
jgi:hypothetical protein